VNTLERLSINKPAKYSPEVTPDLSKDMPDLFDRLPLMFPWDKSQPVDPDQHTVWILDNTAFETPSRRLKHLKKPRPPRKTRPTTLDASGRQVSVRKREETGWQAEFVVCYFVKDTGADVSHVIAAIARMLHIDETDIATRQRIADRVQPFADTVLVKRTLRVDLGGGKEQLTLGPSSYNGISSDLVPLHFDPLVSGPIVSTPINLSGPPNIPSRYDIPPTPLPNSTNQPPPALSPTHPQAGS
jgi:hypothetical protein